MSGNSERVTPQYRRLLGGPLLLLAVVIVVRFALEAAGVSLETTRFLSASVVSALAIVYLGAVAPLRGVTRFRQLAFTAFALSAWLGGWTALTLIVSGVLQLPGSHFATRLQSRWWPVTVAPATILGGLVTHFYDPSQFHLASFMAVEVIGVGFAAGLIVWAIASWVSRATRPVGET